MDQQPYHSQQAAQVVAVLETDARLGLTSAEAAARFERFGPNELPRAKRRSLAWAFIKRFHSGLTYILLVAGAISLFVGEARDAIGIIVVILIDAVFGFVQELKAETAIDKLKEMVVSEATVVRDGDTVRLPASSVVPGDLLLLQEGDRIPADARITEVKDARADESALTGESVPTEKSMQPVAADTALAERHDMVWMGTSLVSGAARAVAVSTGSNTAFGALAVSLGQIRREKPPFVARIDRLGWQLGVIFVVMAGITAFMAGSNGMPQTELFFFAVALAVSAIPEGLPAVLAVVLAIGVQRMAKRKAIVRRIPAVETLGEADVICTDKTGTITENKMTAREIVTVDHVVSVTGEGWDVKGDFLVGDRQIVPAEYPDLAPLLRAAAVATRSELRWQEGRVFLTGDPTETAFVIMAAKAGMEKRHLEGELRTVDYLPFSSDRRFRASLLEMTDLKGNRSGIIFAIGAFEAVSGRSRDALAGGGAVPFDGAVKARFSEASADMARRAMRVIAVAMRPAASGRSDLSETDINEMTFIGLVGIIDPPREGVASAIVRCREAGVRVVMITGDQRDTAMAIAREIGLLAPGADETGIFTESDTAGLSETQFEQVVERAVIFARTTPAAKLRIVTALQRLGHTVAMTGDGVNDAPALKKAAVGISMGRSGTDVAREVADIVLTDDNFISIVNAIEEGRVVFRNIKQTTAYLFTTNLAEMITIIAAVVAGLPLPLLPAQILWMNLVTDGFPDIALATEPPDRSVLRQPPRRRDANFITRGTLILAGLASILMFAGTYIAFSWSLGRSADLDHARTVAFTVMAAFQLWNVFNMRSATRSLRRIGLTANLYVLAAVAISFALQCLVIYLPPLARTFRTTPLDAADWLVILLLSLSIIPVVEVYKWLCRRGFVPQSWQ